MNHDVALEVPIKPMRTKRYMSVAAVETARPPPHLFRDLLPA
jgi:hypothetical protein